MITYYELLKDGTVGNSTPFADIAEQFNLTLTTEKQIINAWDGKRYLEDEVPPVPRELKQNQVRAVRNEYLQIYVDPYQLILRWQSLSKEEQINIINYRDYLLAYTDKIDWWEQNPLTFNEWLGEKDGN